MKSDNVPHFILNSPGCLAFKLTVYVRILCVYQRIHVCVCVRGAGGGDVRQTQRI